MPTDCFVRLAPRFAFPPYAYLPGVNSPHHFTYDGLTTLQCEPPFQSEGLYFALDLYRREFFWETHTCLESLWIAQGRKGFIADFLKALIHCAAAGLKLKLTRADSARDHLRRAHSLVKGVAIHQETLLGFNLRQIDIEITTRLNASVLHPITLLPSWG